MKVRSVRFVALLIACCLLAVGAAADWKESYGRGREAFEAKRWKEVVEAMRAAIEERPQERSGTGFLSRRYTPRYYLGIALAELGNCRQAMRVFEQATNQGQIQDTVDSRDLEVREKACRERLAKRASVLADARDALRAAVAAREKLVAARDEIGVRWDAGEPSLDAMLGQADRLLRQARQHLASQEQSEAGEGLAQIRSLAEAAAAGYRDTLAEAHSRSEALARRRTADARSDLAAVVARAERSLRAVRVLAPYPRRLGQRVAALAAALEAASKVASDANPSRISTLGQHIDEARDKLLAAARQPPRALLDAVERYLTGDWPGVLTVLDGARFREARARDQLCLLRAAAAWSLVELSVPASPAGAAEPSAEAANEIALTPDQQLIAAIESCRALKTPPEPQPRYFSPRFIAYFHQHLLAPEVADPEAANAGAPGVAAAAGAGG